MALALLPCISRSVYKILYSQLCPFRIPAVIPAVVDVDVTRCVLLPSSSSLDEVDEDVPPDDEKLDLPLDDDEDPPRLFVRCRSGCSGSSAASL